MSEKDSKAKLTEEELSRMLKDAFGEYYNSLNNPEGTGFPDILAKVKQAHSQLKKIVEWWSVRNEWPKKIAEKFGLQQKPRVSMFQIAILLELLSLATNSASKKEVVKTWVEEMGGEVSE